MNARGIVLTLALGVGAAASGCEQLNPVTPAPADAGRIRASSAAGAAGDRFMNWKQNFNFGTDGWIAEATADGPAGWCGEIEQVRRGEGALAPSASRGYAVVRQGACNAYWMAAGFAASGPYSPGAGYPLAFPKSGYASELDIWLDPAWQEGTGFSYLVSFTVGESHDLRYVGAPVQVSGGVLQVAGAPVEDAGWYTFRHVFMDDGTGHLTVRFELVRGDEVIAEEDLATTHYTGEAVSTFGIADVGTGYDWFEWITPGLDLAIDEHSVRHGE